MEVQAEESVHSGPELEVIVSEEMIPIPVAITQQLEQERLSSESVFRANSTGHYLNADDVDALQNHSNSDDQLKLKNKIFPYRAEKFSLRIGPSYNAKKMKAASAKALLDLVGCE
jgi:hypothetical protein